MEKWYLQLALSGLLLAACLLGLALSIHFVRKWRDNSDDDQQRAESLLSKFREMHSRGELSDEEFRKIKTDISARIHVAVTVSEDASTAASTSASSKE